MSNRSRSECKTAGPSTAQGEQRKGGDGLLRKLPQGQLL